MSRPQSIHPHSRRPGSATSDLEAQSNAVDIVTARIDRPFSALSAMSVGATTTNSIIGVILSFYTTLSYGGSVLLLTMDTMFHIFTVPFDFYTKPMGYETPKNSFCVIPFNPRPASVGRIYLNSSNPHKKPTLNQRCFIDPEGYDKDTNLFMLKKAREMAQAEPFKCHLKREIAPGPMVTTYEQLCAYGRQVSNTAYHSCGTAKIGDVKNDLMTVVDPQLKVQGIKGLRVADASIFPCMIPINPMVTVLCVGEKAAELRVHD